MTEDDSPENLTDEGDVPVEGVRIIGPKDAIEVTSTEKAVGPESVAPEDDEGAKPSQPEKPQRSDPNPTDYGAVPVVKIDGMASDSEEEKTEAPKAESSSQPSSKKMPATDDDNTYELPHYSDPPTGQVPKVVIDDDPNAAWTELADQPRWRESDREFGEHDFTDLVGDEPTVQENADDFDDESDDTPLPPLETAQRRKKEAESREFFDAGTDLTEDDVSLAARTSGVHRITSSNLPPTEQSELDLDLDDSEAVNVGGGRPGPRRRGPSPTAVAPKGAKGGDRNLGVAVAVGLGLVAIGLACFAFGSFTTTLLATVILVIAGTEFFMSAETAGYKPARFPGIAAVAAMIIAPLYGGFFAYPVVLGLATLVILVWFQKIQPGPNMVMNMGVTMFGIAYVGVLGSFATLGLGVARPFETDDLPNQGVGLLIAAVLVSVCHDVGAYFAGKHLGNRPLSASSPNKTVEGLAGGVLAGMIIPTLILGLAELDPVGVSLSKAFAFSLMCAIVAPIGDLAESAIKRDFGVKDMGTLLPGHGGVLDRFDALLFVLPTAYFMAHLLELGFPVSF